MAKYVVKYYLPNGEKYQLEVQAYNVFHAEKLAKQKLGKKAEISSVSSCDKK